MSNSIKVYKTQIVERYLADHYVNIKTVDKMHKHKKSISKSQKSKVQSKYASISIRNVSTSKKLKEIL